MELRPAGLTVTELAPGVNLERDVLGQADIELAVADDLRAMQPELFHPEPFGLTLREPGDG